MELESFYKNIAYKIRFYRQKLQLTQEQLAEKASLSTDYVGKIEVGINKPGLKALHKIIEALEVSYEKFFSNLPY